MKKLFLALLLIAAGIAMVSTSRANAAIAYVSSATSTPAVATSCAPTAITVGAGNLLVFALKTSSNTSTPQTISDTLGNTWTKFTESTSTLPGHGTWWYAANTLAGSDTITAVIPTSVSEACQVEQYSGVATTNPLDVAKSTNNGTGTDTTCASGAVTSTQNGELIYGSCVQQSANAFGLTPAAGFTLRGFTTRTGAADLVQALAGSISSTITLSASDGWVAAVAAFKAQAAASTPITFYKRIVMVDW